MHKLTNEQSRRMSELLNDVTGTSRQTLFEEALQMGRDSLTAELSTDVVVDAPPAEEPPADVPPLFVDDLLAEIPAGDGSLIVPAADKGPWEDHPEQAFLDGVAPADQPLNP